jgi:hypothetical protein
MDTTTISRCLFLAGALPFVFLGSVHGVGSLCDTRRPTAFWPTDPKLRDAMLASGVLLTQRINMWRAWIGFNLSHSLGAVLFGLVLLFVGRSEEEFTRQARLFLPLAIVVSAAYLVLAIKYWFRIPALGICLSVICLLLSTVARLAGR